MISSITTKDGFPKVVGRACAYSHPHSYTNRHTHANGHSQLDTDQHVHTHSDGDTLQVVHAPHHASAPVEGATVDVARYAR